MILFTEFWVSHNHERNQEIESSLETNTRIFDHIHVLVTKQELVDYLQSKVWKNVTVVLMEGESLTVNNKVYEDRLSFKQLFDYTFSVPKRDIKVISNVDITFEKMNWDLAYELLDNDEKQDTCITLSRWENKFFLKNGHRMYYLMQEVPDCSQDTWIFRNKLKIDTNKLNFILGTRGCENFINRELVENGYLLLNPCSRMITVHHHLCNIRTTSDLEDLRVADAFPVFKS